MRLICDFCDGVLLRLCMHFGFVVLWLAGFSGVRAATLPPEVPASNLLKAPYYQIPASGGGSNVYGGSYLSAGGFIVEINPYDPVAGRVSASFKVRRFSDHVALYTLKQGAGFKGTADKIAFSDGTLLALRVRDSVEGVARIRIHDLATGAFQFQLNHPDPRNGDDFGHNIWFAEDRILIAAPGRDFAQPDAGALFIFNRADGRYMGVVGTGIAHAFFGSEPPDQSTVPYGTDYQPYGVPYVQIEGKSALIVHGSKIYRFFNDGLYPLFIPPVASGHVSLKHALISGNRIVLTTSEQTSDGYVRPGRVAVYDLQSGALLYQLHSDPAGGSFDFPSKIVLWKGKLFAEDAYAAILGSGTKGAVYSHDLNTGKHLAKLDFSQNQWASGMALSGGLLWGFSSTIVDGSDTPARSLVGYDPETLMEKLRLTLPGADFARVSAPRSLGNGRFAVVVSREEFDLPFSAAAFSTFSYAPTYPGFGYSSGVLIYDATKSSWTHRLQLEGEMATNYDYYQNFPKDLRISPGAVVGTFRVLLADSTATQILDFNTVLTPPVPAVMLEGRLHYTTKPGYDYDLLRRAVGETDFSLVRSIGVGDGLVHNDVLPYSDYRRGVRYRLDGSQFSRRISTPVGDPLDLGTRAPTALASDEKRLAVRIPGISTDPRMQPGTVRVLDKATGATVFTLSPASGDGTGAIALTDAYIVVGAPNGSYYSGSIYVFDAVTGGLLCTLQGGKVFGASLVISGNLLAATWVDSSYNSGTYTHTSQLSVYDLTSGSLLRTIPVVSTTSSYSWDLPPTTVVGDGGRVAVRTMASGGSFSGAARIRVIDLATGSTVYELSSPAPETGDYFGNWLAAAGNRLAVGSSGTSEVFIYDFDTGALSHTLALVDRPDGIINYGSSIPRLSIDAKSDLLSWFVSDDPEARTAVYIFDLETGLEEAKVIPPAAAPYTIQTNFGGATLSVDRLIALSTWDHSLFSYSFADALAVPLRTTSKILTPIPIARLKFPTRRGVSYQPQCSSDGGVTWGGIGDKYYGDGQPALIRLKLAGDPDPKALIFRLKLRWESAPVSSGLGL